MTFCISVSCWRLALFGMCPVCDAESVDALEFQRFVLKIFFCFENLLKIFWEAKDWPTLKTSAQLLLFASLSEISSFFYYKLITCDPLETQSFLVAQLCWMWRNDLEGRRTASDHESGHWPPPPRRTWLMADVRARLCIKSGWAGGLPWAGHVCTGNFGPGCGKAPKLWLKLVYISAPTEKFIVRFLAADKNAHMAFQWVKYFEVWPNI